MLCQRSSLRNDGYFCLRREGGVSLTLKRPFVKIMIEISPVAKSPISIAELSKDYVNVTTIKFPHSSYLPTTRGPATKLGMFFVLFVMVFQKLTNPHFCQISKTTLFSVKVYNLKSVFEHSIEYISQV